MSNTSGSLFFQFLLCLYVICMSYQRECYVQLLKCLEVSESRFSSYLLYFPKFDPIIYAAVRFLGELKVFFNDPTFWYAFLV
jgi:hypothetical protein